MAFDADGVPIKGIAPLNNWLPVGSDARSGGAWTCFVEAVSMPGIMGGTDDRFRETELGDLATAGTKPLYRLGGADLVLVDEEALSFAFDVEVLLGVMEQLDARDPRRHEIFRALERCLDLYDLGEDPAAASEAPERRNVGAGGPYRPYGFRGRARSHRFSLALAGTRNGPQVRPHLRQRRRLGRAVPGARLCLFTGAAMVVDEAELPGSI